MEGSCFTNLHVILVPCRGLRSSKLEHNREEYAATTSTAQSAKLEQCV